MSEYISKYIINYLPECLDYESTLDSIYFKSKHIKTSYLIDLSSHFINSFLNLGLEEIPLSSTVLRSRYGVNYNLYVLYLIDKNIISLHKNYLNGKNSRIYKFNKTILDGEIINFKNYDKFLLKRTSRVSQSEFDKSNTKITEEVRQKLISDLYHVELDKECSDYLLNSLKVDREIYLKNWHSIECIDQKQLFYHFDSYGRFHTNFTNLKSIIRKNCLKLKGESTTEIDIKNSQPLLFNKIIDEYIHNYEFDITEINLYKELTLNGKFYEFLNGKIKVENKKKLKDLVYKVLFGKNYPNKFEKDFSQIFPTIYKFIKFYKKLHGDYRKLSYKLQELESNLIFNKIVKNIIDSNTNIPIITVHDSIICRISDQDLVFEIFKDNLTKFFDTNENSIIVDMFDFNIY